MKRRAFLQQSAGVGLVVAFHFTRDAEAAPSKPAGAFAPNAFLHVAPDGEVTVMLGKSEMGQGVMTALPMIVAEELDADWTQIKVEQAGADKAFVTRGDLGYQVTGGSESTRNSWEPLRAAGAAAREMLVAAAAARWNADPSTCSTDNGTVLGPAGQRAGYGELVFDAAARPVPKKPRLKDPARFRMVGKAIPRLDIPQKTDGSARFGIDVRLPGQLTAVIARPPTFGGKPGTWDQAAALAVPGVKQVFVIESGIVVVADSTWAAIKGREALKATFLDGVIPAADSAAVLALLEKASKKKGQSDVKRGDAVGVLEKAAKPIEAVYQTPFLAHATMEPVNCTAWVREGSCEVWGPIQNQTMALASAHEHSGLPKSACSVHTTLLGGGFGRRLESDFVDEAVKISRHMKAPVQVLWTRDDDIQHDFYRPATYHRLRASLSADGWPEAWHHHIVSGSIEARLAADVMGRGMADVAMFLIVDATSVDGASQNPYDIPNFKVSYVRQETGVPVGPWRSVGNSQNAFVVESFVDELAAAAGKDPVEYRRHLLKGKPRHLGVLELAAKESGWGTPLPQGRARGMAVHRCFGSWVAHVAEVSLDEEAVHVHRITSAVDCGLVVNPDIVRAQIQGAVVFGLTAALHGSITIEKGRVAQSNFQDYKLLRMREMPVVDVHLVDSTEGLGGIGEPGVPPAAPAVCNALFALTGKRVRVLPIDAAALAH